MSRHRAPRRRILIPSLAAAGVAVATIGAPLAAADDDRPIVGSVECEQLLAVDVEIVAAATELGAAIDAVGLLGAGGTAEEIAAAEARADVAASTLDQVTADAQARLCTSETPTDPVDPGPEPTDPVEPTTPATPTDPPTSPAAPDRDSTGEARIDLDQGAPDPLATDGSVADISGLQVTVVPNGSVDTGAP